MSGAIYLKPGLVEQIKSANHLESDADVAKAIGCSRHELENLRDHRQCMSVGQVAAVSVRFRVPFSEVTTNERSSHVRKNPLPHTS